MSARPSLPARLHRAFTQHPASVGESYGEHCASALRFGLAMIAAGLACILHAFVPFLFVRTGSRQVVRLHESMVTHRSRLPEPIDFVI
ncbi:DUF6356 family protein [Erythrobacter sp.]|uniref:DUF6356 family protein n=1 Tax=Erythrobacter sp. TaxID=1042 RepID=UPI001425BFC0|nr:DUF6356 family protein [Erythrobacter sp.]QIQ87214.1 MAG: hypothetical protein G9473_11345 [Erythrobacter sp.]